MTIATDSQHLFVVTITGDRSFSEAIASALALLESIDRRVLGKQNHISESSMKWPSICQSLLDRSTQFLDAVLPKATIELVVVPFLDQLEMELHRRIPTPRDHGSGPQPWSSGVTALFLIDATTGINGDVEDRLDTAASVLYQIQKKFGIGLSPYSVVVYDEYNEDDVYSHIVCNARKTPDESWMLAVETIRSFTDLVQNRHINTRAILPNTDQPTALAATLSEFLTIQSGKAWGLHFFTGSIVSKMIQDTTNIARRAGNPVLRGPSEHSLACGALARWQLHQAPFLLVATAGMVDELRGTLANLRDSQANGFIVFGETEPGGWLPFQGTVHHEEDARAVFAARGVPCFYLTDPNRLGQDLQAVFRAYYQRCGPIVILASPSVLAHTGHVELPKVTCGVSRPQVDEDTVDAVADIINSEPSTLLWQCGHLTEDERKLVYQLAHRAGIALVDSLGRPGTVARYNNGHVVDEYLGTLGLYGSSPAVWRLLHPSDQALRYDEHAIFFLKSRIPDLATPFSERALYERHRIVQVTDTPRHIAPFTDLPIVENLQSLLVRLSGRVLPEDRIVQARRRAIAVARQAPVDPLSRVASLPMSHEYFFTQLNAVLEELIHNHGYTYTGFYDVGRGGISAVRNLVRTGEGISGWYGRALMGDALLAIPSIALSEPANILGFIGDGAARLAPSILPSLAQQLRYESGHIDGNVSIFYLLNGGFSIIRSYRELQHAATTDTQMSVLTQVEPEWQQKWGNTLITHERLTRLDAEQMAERLLKPATVNLFSVYLAHDNEGDSIMPASRKNWRLS